MWEFLGDLLDKAGFWAVVYAVTVGGLVLAIRALWKRGGQLEEALRDARVAIEKVRREEAEKRSAMREVHDAQIAAVVEERREEAEKFADALAELQERRVQDAHTTTREAVQHIAETRNSVQQITHAMMTLERVMRGP